MPGRNQGTHQSRQDLSPSLNCAGHFLVEAQRFLSASAGAVEGTRIWPLARKQFLDAGYAEEIARFDFNGNELSAVLRYSRPASEDKKTQKLALVIIEGEKHGDHYLLPCVEVNNHGLVSVNFSPSLISPGALRLPKEVDKWKQHTERTVAKLEEILDEDPRVTNIVHLTDDNGCRALYVASDTPQERDSLEAEFQHFCGVKMTFGLFCDSSENLPRAGETLIGLLDALSIVRKFVDDNRLAIRAYSDTKHCQICVESTSEDDLTLLMALLPEDEDTSHAYGWPIVFLLTSPKVRLEK